MLTSDKKQKIRQDLLLRRSHLNEGDKNLFDHRIQSFCRALLEEYRPSIAAGYRSLKHEASLDGLFFSENQKWAFPVVTKNHLTFRLAESFHSFDVGSFGVLEPSSDCLEIPLENCPLVFVPGVAFDGRGKRLGMGKGYYDKALSSYSGVKVGVCYKLQILEESLPHEAHDVEMDFIVTEDFILSPIHNKRLN